MLPLFKKLFMDENTSNMGDYCWIIRGDQNLIGVTIVGS